MTGGNSVSRPNASSSDIVDDFTINPTPAETKAETVPHPNKSLVNAGQAWQDDINLPDKEQYATQEIEYLYLDFDTELPAPAGLSEPNPEFSISPPPCPNLKKYTSPFLWSSSRKSMTTWLACGVTLLAAYSAGEYTPASAQLLSEWNVSQVAYNVGVTTFTVGFGIAPMVLAPFSEINGRRPVFIASGILFTACIFACGGANNLAGTLVARFFKGIGGSTYSTMVGGVISDIYHAEDRNTPMALFAGAALFGTGLGPLIAGNIVVHASWRWIYWSHGIVSAGFVVFMYFFLKETRGSILLSRKAHALNRWYDSLEGAGYFGVLLPLEDVPEKRVVRRIRWKVKADEDRQSIVQMISVSCYRPFHLLFTEPVVFFFSLWVSFSWAVLYLQLSSIPLVMKTSHHFTVAESGDVFTAISIGAILATLLSIYQEKLAIRFGKMSNTPEGRLYFACIESILMPVGLFWFGWSSFPSVPWIVPTMAVACATMGIFSVYLAVFNYLADTYHRYASSAIAAQSCCRNLLGGVFPLVTNAMFNNLGFPAASSLLGGIGALLTIVPWVLVFYGPRIRARSKFASELVNHH
ncbi:MFS multidrug transporter, putative [Talaromyces stipitatus ATCC 10500]|uniref:MFS multidrug transporter, putative n=1 Tax=Talaromyces stipitatus (strain ATCC 10500 / CBS 375.48 / QM 6759 / NRRL 1006) TaxID=441959 RepID=B8MHV9_TALSN|nr:MFS multidrug transporter, putative [Talaromyces stipitatus ATCC 10500]EED16439.1 MFS multidrug transporter, putative [Talaromyces stipitatus ATCC 10500]